LLFVPPTRTSPLSTLSLHDALPICPDPASDARGRPDEAARFSRRSGRPGRGPPFGLRPAARAPHPGLSLRLVRLGRGLGRFRRRDRKSTRLNSSHVKTSYAVFCLKK